MNKTLGIIQKVLSVILALLVLMAWFKWTLTIGGDTDSDNITGLETLLADLAPIALIVLMFKPGDKRKTNKYYLYASMAGFVFAIITGIYEPIYYTSSKYEKVTWSYGIWLSLIMYAVLFGVTILNYPIDESGVATGNSTINSLIAKAQSLFNINKKREGDSDKQSSDNIQSDTHVGSSSKEQSKSEKSIDNGKISNDESENMQKRQFCVYCGSKLKEGALFCTKCGKKVGEE